MRLDKLGEFGLIDRIRKMIKTDSSVIKGSGDDCAVLKFDKGRYLLATCDTIVEGVDFVRKDKPYLIGRKSLAVSLSDIAACAGIPRYALVSLGLPKRYTVEFVDSLYKGIRDLAKRYELNLIGGDLSRAERLFINTSVLGWVEKRYLVLRNGARVGDIIFVTGTLGDSHLGGHLRFQPRIKEARFLVRNFKINAMIDISDGLIQDLSHILEESRVGAVIYETLLPQARYIHNLKDILYRGEDFELLFSLSNKEAKRLLRKRLPIFSPIGEIVKKNYGLILIDKDNRKKQLAIRGLQHF
ncbi:MAG: thiamine-phosphate kinase [Candidatus Omnitrophica bacterium]|nr:thiamine-phosphate kinase [Candidatus Omnitrophota bacterium]